MQISAPFRPHLQVKLWQPATDTSGLVPLLPWSTSLHMIGSSEISCGRTASCRMMRSCRRSCDRHLGSLTARPRLQLSMFMPLSCRAHAHVNEKGFWSQILSSDHEYKGPSSWQYAVYAVYLRGHPEICTCASRVFGEMPATTEGSFLSIPKSHDSRTLTEAHGEGENDNCQDE